VQIAGPAEAAPRVVHDGRPPARRKPARSRRAAQASAGTPPAFAGVGPGSIPGRRCPMADLVYVAVSVLFFALAWGYVAASARL
jgi:hypothetical protein